MFSTSRIVAIDDERDQLDKLCRVLHGMGIPCIPIHYPTEVPAAAATWFGGVRVAFCDLHLMDMSRSEKNFPAVGSLLDRMSSARTGPLLLILWTKYPDEAEALEAYLAERHPDSKPVAVVALDKTQFEGSDKAALLPQAVRERLDAIPQLRSLLEWEDDVGAATGACVGSLLKLALQQGGDTKDALDVLLSSLAQAATGKALAAEDPGTALAEVLMPMLADQLAHLPDDELRITRWRTALSKAAAQAKCETTLERAAAVNTALSVVHGDKLRARERGAVVAVLSESVFRLRFGLSAADILPRFALKDAPTYRWVAIEVEAVCDYAQLKSASLPFVLAVEVSADAKLVDKKYRPISLWESPPFLSESGARVRLVANVQFVSTLSPPRAKNLPALYRLREPWVNELAYARARHESRPGIVALYGD